MIKITSIATASILAVTLSGSTLAADALSADEAKALFSGKTLDGHNIKKDKDYKIYSDPNGEAIHQSSRKTQTVSWEIKPDGQHCMHFKKKSKCGFIEPAGNGVYNKIVKGRHTNTLGNFVEGNQL
jgi:hypothetical protein